MNTIRSALQRIRESLFLVPLLIMVLCIGLAALAVYLDSRFADNLQGTPLLLASTVAGGRSIASAVAGATITVAAIVFSITALSSQIAANQYSPRSVRGFFEDAFQQVIIGLIVGTFTYSLLILGALSSSLAGTVDPAPSFSVTGSILLGVASAIGIVAYIDHSLRRFQIDAVVRRIAVGTLAAVRRQHRGVSDESVDTSSQQPSQKSGVVVAARTGWIQRINPKRLAQTLPPDTVVRVVVRLGEAVSAGDQLATVWPDPAESKDVIDSVRKAILTARERSLEDDPAFGIRQLTDIALKALSPGINDPTTAVDVIHHLKVPIREILQSEPPLRVFNGPSGQRIYLSETLSRSDYVHYAFAEIRLAAGHQPSVLNALLEVLTDLTTELEGAHLTGRIAALEEEIALTVDATINSGLPREDIDRVLGPFKIKASEPRDEESHRE